MNAERYQLLRELFFAVCDLAPEEREAYLRDACRDDPALRADLAGLLAHDAEDAAVLEEHLTEDLRRHLVRIIDEYDPDLPESIGRYRIIRRIGAGGMGSVYEAEQDQPKRRVALKVIRNGDRTEERRRRFDQEAHVLGLLRHPGIAQIYEAGIAQTANGEHPFFAMELVEGEPLLAYASTHNLDVDERLVLVAKVAQAVHHAHQKGVIHRDLKPTNILVDETGEPKVLDFGVARATDLDLKITTLHTAIGQLIGTVNYMSPEQASGDPREIDTRSDIYSLGVIAFELLSGRLPYDVQRKMVHEVVRVIREDDPSRLSTIDRTLRGDVETIVAKALAKEKERRYQAASDFAADINRFLSDEPIIARPPSATYQLRKFALRNRGLVAGVATAFILLLLGVAGTTYGLIQARDGERLAKQREQEANDAKKEAQDAKTLAEERLVAMTTALSTAELERDKANSIAEFFEGLLRSAGPDVSQGRELTVAAAVDEASEKLQIAADLNPVIRASLHRTIGSTYRRLGRWTDAELHLKEAVSGYEQHVGHMDPLTLGSLNDLALVHRESGQVAEAIRLFRYLQNVQAATYGINQMDYVLVLNNLGASLLRAQEPGEAREVLEAARTIAYEIGHGEHEIGVSITSNLALAFAHLGLLDQAIDMQRRVFNAHSQALGATHSSALVSMANLGSYLDRAGKFVEADEILTELIRLRRSVLAPDHPDLLNSLNNLGTLKARRGDLEGAASLLAECLNGWKVRSEGSHPRAMTTLLSLGNIYADLGRLDDTERVFLEYLDVCERSAIPPSIEQVRAMSHLARVASERQNYEEFERWCREAFETSVAALGREHERTLAAELNLGSSLIRLERFEDAEHHLIAAHSKLVPRQTDSREQLHSSLRLLVQLYRVWGRQSEADHYLELLESLQTADGETVGSQQASPKDRAQTGGD